MELARDNETNMILKPLPNTSLNGFEYKLGKTKTRKNLKLLLQSYFDKDQSIEDVEEQNYIKYEITDVLYNDIPSEWVFGKISIKTLNIALKEESVKFEIEEDYKEIPEDFDYYVVWYIKQIN
jgi:hypothetical protein